MLRFLLFVNLILAGLFAGGPQSTKSIRTIQSVITGDGPRTTPATYRGRQLAVGHGGGFTGASTTYVLLDNGQLFIRHNLDTTYTLIGKRPATDVKRLFKTVENRCRIKSTRFNHPGNTYRFVQWRKAAQLYRVAWGEDGQSVPAAYPAFFRSFMALMPTRPTEALTK